MAISDPADREASNWNVGFGKVLMQGDIMNLQSSKKSYSRHNCLPKSNANSLHANSVRAPVKLNYCICTQVQFQNSETIHETAQYKQLEKNNPIICMLPHKHGLFSKSNEIIVYRNTHIMLYTY